MKSTSTIDQVLNEAMSLRPSERAIIAQKLINSLSTNEDEIEEAWLKISDTRLKEIKNKKVTPVSWKEIKEKVKNQK